jgi:peroxygenase
MAPARTEEDGFDVCINEVPVTGQRRPFIQKDDDQKLKHPGYIPNPTSKLKNRQD